MLLAARWFLRVSKQVWRRWWSDHCSREAAALAFKTALGIVPFLAIAFTLLKVAGMLDERSAFVEFFSSLLFPAVEDARASVSASITTFADNIAGGALGTFGPVVLLVIVYFLCDDIEHFWNRVWSAPRQRPLVSKFFVFYAVATLVPFLLAVSLYHTARFWRGGLLAYLVPLASTFGALLLANKLLPVVRVRWRWAAFGAALSALLFELAKFGFARYMAFAVTKYNNIYGALALLPLFLVWIYLAWIVVLLGAEMAHAAQRLGSLEAGDRRRTGPDGAWELVTGVTAARLMIEVSRRFVGGDHAPSFGELAERLALPEEVVLRVLGRLRERGLVLEATGDLVGWLPARPPTAIKLNEVLGVFRVGDPDETHDQLGRILREIDAHQRARGEVSLAELLDRPSPGA